MGVLDGITDAELPVSRGRAMAPRRQVGWWLIGMAGLLLTMIVVGGATRLTDSGLSITEWRPVTGVLPPLSAEAWEAEFEKYRQIPEYQLVNRGMSLAEFKTIYYWEWGHRLLGRVIGLAFALGLLYFHLTRKLDRGLALRLWGLFLLGGLQGALGWYMVQSGLVDRVDVSQYRLVAHLGLAFFIFACIVWVACDLLIGPEGRVSRDTREASRGLGLASMVAVALIYLQCLMGGFVAGLDAGMTYNSWPLMDDRFIPAGLGDLAPWWRNLFENITTVQFAHRMLAYAVGLVVIVFAGLALVRPIAGGARASVMILLAAVSVQIVLGIWTLLAVVPLHLGAAHQAGAALVLAAGIHAVFRLTRAPFQGHVTPITVPWRDPM